jgi:hypothetical protein
MGMTFGFLATRMPLSSGVELPDPSLFAFGRNG